MNRILLLFIMSTYCILLSCTIKYNLESLSTSKNKSWYKGIEYSHISEDDIEIMINFQGAVLKTLHFYLEITNYDSNDILIEPNKITCFFHDNVDIGKEKKYIHHASGFGKTTLFQNETVSGTIVLPSRVKKKYLTINIPIGSKLYYFKYKQTIKHYL